MKDEDYKNAVLIYSDLVYRLAFLYMRNVHDASDCCQNVFIKLLNYKNQFNGNEHLKAWLIRVTKNECLNFFKSFWRKNIQLTDEKLEFSKEDRENELLQIILKLPLKYRDVLYLHYYEGFKVLEIANMLNLKESNIKTRLKRGRDALKIKLVEGGYDYE